MSHALALRAAGRCQQSRTARTGSKESLVTQPDRRAALTTLSALWLAACGGGGSDDTTATAPAPAPVPAPAPTPAPATTSYGDFARASLGIGAALNGALSFPADNAWNTDVSSAPVDPNSDALIASIGLTTGPHADFGSGTYLGSRIGIPYVVVSGTQARVPITWTDYQTHIPTGDDRFVYGVKRAARVKTAGVLGQPNRQAAPMRAFGEAADGGDRAIVVAIGKSVWQAAVPTPVILPTIGGHRG